MSAITVEKVTDQPIAIATFHDIFKKEDVEHAIVTLFNLIDKRPFYFVIDFTLHQISFSTMTKGFSSNVAAMHKHGLDFSEITLAYVGMDELGNTVAQIYAHEEFGKRRVLLFDTLDEGLAAISAELRGG